jgi:hypothetical protein
MKTFDVNIEEAAAESEQDRRDLAKLAYDVGKLLQNSDAMLVPTATKRLIDGGVDPVVVAKTLLIGSRPGGYLYQLSARTPQLERDEQAAELNIAMAIRDAEVDTTALTLVVGAVWLAVQYSIDRDMLAGLVTHAARRPQRADRAGYGVVDFVDSHGVGDRQQIVQAIRLAQLPAFAPLSFDPKVSS